MNTSQNIVKTAVVCILACCISNCDNSAKQSGFIKNQDTPVNNTACNIETSNLSVSKDQEKAFEETEEEDMFTITEIPDSIFKRMEDVSFRGDSPVAREELRLVRMRHYDFDGNRRMGKMVCHADVAEEVAEIFKELYMARYPIHSIRLIEDFGGDDDSSMKANNSSCFNTRGIGGGEKPSMHSYGRAIDINPLYNPLVKVREGKTIVQPSQSVDYAARDSVFKGKIDREDLCYKLFTARGWKWGGAWKSVKDYQHFEKP